MYERILRIHEALPAPSNCDHAVALRELAALRRESGSPAGSDTLCRKADEIMADLNARALAAAAVNSDDTESSEDDEEVGSSDAVESEDSDDEENGSRHVASGPHVKVVGR